MHQWMESDQSRSSLAFEDQEATEKRFDGMIDLLDNIVDQRGPEGDRVTVTDMRRSDVPEVMKLEKRCYTLPWSSSAYITEIGNPNAQYLIAKLGNGDLVGYGGVWVVMDEMHITTLAVDPAVRGRKIGERLLIRLMQEGVKRGALRATLEVRQNNRVAHRLYEKYDFRDVGIRKAYYSDNGENAHIMWAENVAAPEFLNMLQRKLSEIESAHGEARSR